MTKKIAVVVRDRQEEALRMSLGMVLMDDTIDVYVLDRTLGTSEEILMNIETMQDMEMNLYTNVVENRGLQYLPLSEIAERLLHYDIVVPY